MCPCFQFSREVLLCNTLLALYSVELKQRLFDGPSMMMLERIFAVFLLLATLEDFLQGLKTGTRKLCRGIATGTMPHALFVGRFLGFERPNWF